MPFRLKARLASLVSSLPASYWFLWLGTLVNRLGGFVAPFLSLYLTGERGVSVAQASLVVGLFGGGSFAAALVGGELSDRLGRRPVMLMSFFLTPAAVMVVGLVGTLPIIAASTFLLGFLTDLYRPAVSATVADVVPPALRTRAYGYLYWAINVGASVAPMAAGLMARASYLPLFIGDAATTFVYGLIVFWRIPESRPSSVSSPLEKSPDRRGPPERGRLRIVGRDPLLLLFTGLSLLSGMVYSQGYSTLPVDMQAHSAGPEQYGLAIAVNGLVIVLLGIPASHSAIRWPRFGAMSVSALLIGVGFGMNGFLHTLPFYLLSVVVWTLGEVAAASVAPAIIADLAPVRLRGLYQGIYGSSWGLAFFLGPALGGLVLQHFGSTVLWSVAGALGLIVAAGYLGVGRFSSGRRATIDDVDGRSVT